MKRRFLLSWVVCWGLVAIAWPALSMEKSGQETLVKGNTLFAVALYQRLAAEQGNLFFSPYSVSSALGMTFAGARGDTEKEMAGALHFTLGQDELHKAFGALDREMTATARASGQRLDIANALVLTGGQVQKEYQEILRTDYDAEVFSGGLDKINQWVNKKTDGRIERILEELSPNSVCVILNAVYFKGLWEFPFRKSDTLDNPFFLSQDNPVRVPFMNQEGPFKLLEEGGFQALYLPYKDNSLAMVVFLPWSTNGLAALEKNLSAENLGQWLEALDRSRVRKVKVELPKFRLETKYDLAASLSAMGMPGAFVMDRADFRGMGWPKGDLWINQVKHKAYVEVDEEGTTAAGATAVEMATKSIMAEPVFRADHPFVFLIRDNRTNTIVFLGRMADPRAN
jgi:serpin B